MNWFGGDVTAAIQKTIAEKKVFLVFVYDDNEDSKSLDELWENEEVSSVCSPDKCVCIKLQSNSVGGLQFASIYPILNVPCTYLISSDGLPSEVIPGCPEKQEFLQRLNSAIEKTLSSTQPSESSSKDDTITKNKELDKESESTENEQVLQKEPFSSSVENISKSESDEILEQSDVSKKEKAEALLEKSRALKAQKEKEKEKESERKRRQEGIELTRARKDLAERQARNLSQEIAKQRAEERAAREKVRQQIKQDRAEKAARHETEKQERLLAQTEANKAASSTTPPPAKVSKSSSSRIQFKLPDGSTKTSQFQADDNFHVVYTAAEECVRHLQIPVIRLTTVFPKYEFKVEDNMKSLRELNLVPTASIIISKGASKTSQVSNSNWNPLSLIFLLFSPILSIFQWIASFFSTTPSSSTQNTPQSTLTINPTSQNNSSTAAIRRRLPNTGGSSNIRQLQRDDSSDNENGTWNGNSTQQM